ncbi:UDP-3-O-(3-hydroxymyristoyl)glucosamine N-acyltransferase [Nitratifractor sp.]
MSHTIMTICRYLDLPYEGEDREISGIATLAEAGPEDLSFFHNEKYRKDLPSTRAAAVLTEEKYASELPEGVIPLITDEPYLLLARATELFAHRISTESEPPRLLGECEIDSSVRFGRNVTIGEGTVILAGTYIGDDVTIGENCLIHPNVTIYHGSRIGERCILHSGCVIGSDGYGFAHTRDGRHVKIHQLGGVVLGDEVEIGANTTVDRGALGDTIIGSGTKIDNQVQIGHNCMIGEHCLIVAQCGLAGSTKLGRNVVLGGQSATAGHLEIGDFAQFAARSGVTKSMEGGKVYGGAPAMEIKLWRRQQAALMRLAKGKK